MTLFAVSSVEKILFFIVLLPEKSGALLPTLPDDLPFIPLMKTELPEKNC